MLPQASAGPSFHAAISSGKFHGMICPQTPTGSRSVKLKNAGSVGIGLAGDLVHPAGVVAEGLRRRRDVDVPGSRRATCRCRASRAAPARRRAASIRSATLSRILCALGGRHARPRAGVEGAPRGAHRAVDVLRVALGDAREHLAGGGVERLEGLARCGLDPLPVDQHLAHRRADELLDRRLDASGDSHGDVLPWLVCDRVDASTGRLERQRESRPLSDQTTCAKPRACTSARRSSSRTPGPPAPTMRSTRTTSRWSISPSPSASTRCGASSTTSPTTRCVRTSCSTSPGSRRARHASRSARWSSCCRGTTRCAWPSRSACSTP